MPPPHPACLPGDQPSDTRVCQAQAARGSWAPLCAGCPAVSWAALSLLTRWVAHAPGIAAVSPARRWQRNVQVAADCLESCAAEATAGCQTSSAAATARMQVNIPCRNIIIANNLIYNPTWYARVRPTIARCCCEMCTRGRQAVQGISQLACQVWPDVPGRQGIGGGGRHAHPCACPAARPLPPAALSAHGPSAAERRSWARSKCWGGRGRTPQTATCPRTSGQTTICGSGEQERREEYALGVN